MKPALERLRLTQAQLNQWAIQQRDEPRIHDPRAQSFGRFVEAVCVAVLVAIIAAGWIEVLSWR